MMSDALMIVVLIVIISIACLTTPRTGFAGEPNRATVWPKEIGDVLYNPGMGFMTQRNLDGDVASYPKSTVAQWDWYWDEIEPEKGQYRWDLVDDVLRKTRERGQRAAIRMGMPANGRNGTPQWYWDLGAKGFEYQSESGPINRMPDHNDPLYLEHMGRLIRAFGERYDGHPDIEFVDIRSLGHWGEWHFHFVEKSHGWQMRVSVTPEVRRALVDIYLESFNRTPLVMLIGGGEELAYAIQHGAGWRADCLGDLGPDWNHMNDCYQQLLDAAGAEDAWKHGPVVFEACWDMQHWADEGWDVEHVFNEALRWHCSVFNNKSSPVPPRWWSATEAFLRKMGYRLVLRYITHPAQIAAGRCLPVECRWENIGVAPPYRKYLVAWQLTAVDRRPGASVRLEDRENAVDVTKWLPGGHDVQLNLAVPLDLEEGRYRLAVALLDPFTRQPAVQLAIEGRDAQGWYNLSEVQVTAGNPLAQDAQR